MQNKSWKTKIISDYQDQYKKFGIHSSSLFFPGRKQNVRFNVIKEIGIGPDDSVLDVGCGFGDLLHFLKETIDYKGHYTGADITPEFIEVCQSRYPENDFRLLDILEELISEQWDYVVLSGTLNINIGKSHLSFTKKMITRMLDLSKKGVSVDFVSTYGDNRNKYLFRADPSRFFSYCKTLTNRVSLRNDYLLWEFTIYLYKDDSISEDNIFTNYKFPEIIRY